MSEQSTSTPASSSIAARRLTIAPLVESNRAPTAMVTESTVGMATGIAATVSTRQNSRVVSSRSPCSNATTRIRLTSTTASTISTLPI